MDKTIRQIRHSTEPVKPLPISQEQAIFLLQKIKAKGKLALVEEKFNYSYGEIFGEALEIAKNSLMANW